MHSADVARGKSTGNGIYFDVAMGFSRGRRVQVKLQVKVEGLA